MTEKISERSNPLDIFKWVFSFVVMSGTAYASYIYADVFLVYKIAGVLAGVLVATAVLATTKQGRSLIDLLKGAKTEMRKVVWPSYQETKSMTGVVLLITAAAALLLWLIDLFIGLSVSWLIR